MVLKYCHCQKRGGAVLTKARFFCGFGFGGLNTARIGGLEGLNTARIGGLKILPGLGVGRGLS